MIIPKLALMRKNIFPLKVLLISIFLIASVNMFSQSVSINTTRAKPNASAGLDISFPDRGFLIPRVALQSTVSSLPLTSHVAGMIVYNTVTLADIKPGLYINDGIKWRAFAPPQGVILGNMFYWNGTTWVVITPGTAGQHLRLNGSGIPEWF